MRIPFLSLIFGILFHAGILQAGVEIPSADFYVSPQGNDAWTGKSPVPNADGSDGPLASVAGAQNAVRKLKNQGPLPKKIVVQVGEGVYGLEKPIVFTSEDSGTEKAPISYIGFPGGKTVLSGGVRIAGWQKGEKGVWTTTVPGVKEGAWNFRSLWVNGQRALRARTPNVDWFFAAGPIAEIDRSNPQLNNPDMASKKGLKYRDDDLRKGSNQEDATVVVYHAWTASLHGIESIDTANKIVRFTNPSQWPMGWWEKDLRYYVENVPEALDAPGEWYLDRRTGVLSYIPRPGEDMATAEVIAPRLTTLLHVAGDAAKGKTVEHLKFEGISFQHTDWNLERNEMADGQGAAFLNDATVFLRGARHCELRSCEIAHTGGYGLWCERGSKQNRIEQCHLYDLGAGGVRLGENALPRNPEEHAEANRVVNCFLHDGGKVYQAGIGVLIGQSSHNEVLHNEISDFLYSGVSVGWSWGYAPSTAHHNTIAFNHIHHLGFGKLSDMAGIYSLGDSPGTTLRNNRIHDVLSFSYGGWGLYTDEGSTGIVMENNIVYRVKDGCFHQHYGKENLLRNNILAYSFTKGQINRTRNEAHQSFRFERNIVYFDRADLFAGNWATGSFPFDSNCYWDASGRAIRFPGGLTLEQWQAKGQDRHSLVADPRFTDPQHGDFSLAPDSPARTLGFQPIDINEIGLTGPQEWRDLPSKIERPTIKFPGE